MRKAEAMMMGGELIAAGRRTRIAVRWSCPPAVVLFLLLLFAVAPAHATQQTLWLDDQYWQTGQLGSESFAHEDPAVAGYLASHTLEDTNYFENFTLTESGQYCAYKGLSFSVNKAEATAWFPTPTPNSSYQEGDGNEDVCAVWSPSGEKVDWGLQLNNHAPKHGTQCDYAYPIERCGIQHYFSLAGQGLNDHPWAGYYVAPELRLDDVYDKLKLQDFQAGEKGLGWGYMCPVLEDQISGNIVEVCYEQWEGYGPHNKEPEWHYEHMGECKSAYSGFEHNYDKVIVPYHKEILWDELTEEPLKESQFPIEVWGKGKSLEIAMGSAKMTEIAEFDDTSFKTKETAGGYLDEPEITYGCGRSSSTTPSDWALIGVANGMEEWETEKAEPGRSESQVGLANEILESIDVRTVFSPHAVEIAAENERETAETEATVAGEVNPYGFPTSYVVEYGTGSVGEHTTAETSAGSGITSVPVSAKLTGLTPGATYKYRIKASHTTIAGAWYGAEQTFSTLSRYCASIQGAGSSLQRVVQKEVWSPRWTEAGGGWEGHCAGKPSLTYNPTSSGKGKAQWGYETKTLKSGESGETSFPAFIATDVAPTATQIKRMGEAGEQPTPVKGVMAVPVAQAAIAVVVSLPTNCKPEPGETTAWIKPSRLKEEWEGGGKTFIKYVEGIECTSSSYPSLKVQSSNAGTTAVVKRYFDTLVGDVAPWKALTETPLASEESNWPATLEASGHLERCCENDSSLAEVVYKTPGTSGYADLADARSAGFAAADEWVEHENAAHEKYWSAIAEMGTTKPSEEYESPEEYGGGVNCRKAKYKEENVHAVAPAEDWSEIRQENVTEAGAYPLCTFTFDLVWNRYETPALTTKYGAEPTSKEARNTVLGYLKWIVSAAGQNAALKEKHYGALPAEVQSKAEAGVNETNID